MFVVHCQRCGKRRLVGAGRVRAVQNIARGVIAVEVQCYCGNPVVLLTGGGRAPVQVAVDTSGTGTGAAGTGQEV